MKTSKKVDFQATEAYYEGERGKSTMKKDYSEEKKQHMLTLGQNIRRIRQERELSQEQLANLCGHTNSNARSWISKIESGTNDPPASELKLIARALGVTCIELMHGKDEDAEKKKACELFEHCYGSEVFRLVQAVIQLDQADRLILYGEALGMLKAEKYAVKKGSSEDMAM